MSASGDGDCLKPSTNCHAAKLGFGKFNLLWRAHPARHLRLTLAFDNILKLF
jgi:hypothetical protein